MPQHHLRRRFEQAQDEILSAISDGPVALAAFQKHWSRLVVDFDEAAHLDRVDKDISMMAQSTAIMISTISESFLRLDAAASDRHTALTKSFHVILDDTAPPPSGLHKSASFDPVIDWLILNIHNPYPSTATKEELARVSGMSLESVSAWLQSSREQIGWTALAQHHFDGSRSAIMEAAHRAFIEPDATRPLSRIIQRAFAAIKLNAEKLRNAQCTDIPRETMDPSKSCTKAVELSIPRGNSDEGMGAMGNRLVTSIEDSLATKHLTQPSSPLSPPRVLQIPDVDETEQEDMTPPPPIAGRKRRAEDAQDSDSNDHSPARLLKRRKPGSSSSAIAHPSELIANPPLAPEQNLVSEAVISFQTHLTPESMSQRGDCSTASSYQLPSLTTLPSSNVTPSAYSRKRRSSDASCDIVPKRPRTIRSGPRLQTVSDSVLYGANEGLQDPVQFERWYQSVPNPVPVELASRVVDDPSPAAMVLNTPSDDFYNELPTLPADFFIPSQQIDLSDDDFQAMLASHSDDSLNLAPVDHDVLATLSFLDDIFPSSTSGLSNHLSQQPVQCILDLGCSAGSHDQTEGYSSDTRSSPSLLLHTPLSYLNSNSEPTWYTFDNVYQDDGLRALRNDEGVIFQELCNWIPSPCQSTSTVLQAYT
uniref:B1 homeodomain mating type protein n=1 Tax=Heterobasidion annosum TaxID=13563 RepID=S5RW41_HETAN|nr:b1 homeodomain mating type protein [Heterobasidion annosum]